MARFAALLAAFMLILTLGMGSVAHALEPVSCSDPAVELFAGHADSDTPDDKGDSEKAAAHSHAGCHGHHFATALETGVSLSRSALAKSTALNHFAGLPDSGAHPALRPPIA
jgi:hypothetical protein